MLIDSHRKIIHSLNQTEKFKTAKQLSGILKVSVRSIRNYVSQINEKYPTLVISTQHGYTLNREIFTEHQNKFQSAVAELPQSPKERLTYIINTLIQYPSQKLHIFELADSLFVSEQTIRKDLTKIRDKIEDFELQLKIENYYIKLEGIEKNKRKLLTSILYNETNRNFLNLDSLQYHFKNYNIKDIKKIIDTILLQYHYFINDYAMMNLILHLLVAMDRISLNHTVHTNIYEEIAFIRQHEKQISYEITEEIYKTYQIKFPEQEIFDFALLIMSSATNLDYNQINTSNLSSYVPEHIIHIVKRLITSLSDFYNIPLQEEQFFIRFTLHINNLFRRLHANITNKNPLTSSIKKNCPLIYDCAVHMSNILQEEYPIEINDDEIAYIAIHIGGAIETQKNLNNKVTCVLYCPQYYDLNMNILEKLTTKFQDTLIIKHIFTDADNFDQIETDFIITTVPIDTYTLRPIIQIQPFITHNDLQNTKDLIQNIKLKKKKETFHAQLLRMTHENFFYHSNKTSTLTTREACIDFLTSKLVDETIVTEYFSENIWKREQLSSTAFGHVAIPHTMKMDASQTVISILINEDGIQWTDTQKVKVVLMLATNKKDRQIFGDLFETLSMILTDDSVIEDIIKLKSLHEIVELLVNQVTII